MSRRYTCSCCGEVHEGLAAWAFRRPDYWVSLTDEERARGLSSDDLCETGDGYFFIRCRLALPVLDAPEEEFELGVWCSLSEANFRRYVETFDRSDQSSIGGMFGWLSNEILQFRGSRNLKSDVWPQDGRQRPVVSLHAEDHPLVRAQTRGIRLQDALGILHAEDRQIVPE